MQAAYKYPQTLVSIKEAIQTPPRPMYDMSKWVNLCLTYIEYIAPREVNQETGRIVKLLSNYPSGLSKEEILELFYTSFQSFSLQRQLSLKACLEKIIQRARKSFSKYEITIQYNKDNKKYYVLPTVLSEKYMH